MNLIVIGSNEAKINPGDFHGIPGRGHWATSGRGTLAASGGGAWATNAGGAWAVSAGGAWAVTGQCCIIPSESYLQDHIIVASDAQPLELIKQTIYIAESSPLSAIIPSTPGLNWFVGGSENVGVFCPENVFNPELEFFKPTNWPWSSLERQLPYYQMTIGEGYKKAIEKISTFQMLVANWDTYNGKEIDSNCISRASKIMIENSEWMAQNNIPSPFIAPRSDGSIQMEWESGPRYLELGIVPDSSMIEFLVMDEDHDGKPVEFEGILKLEASIKELLTWFIKGEAKEIEQLFNKLELLQK